MEKNTGVGFVPGVGIEYSRNDKFRLTLTSGYSLILLKEEKREIKKKFLTLVLHRIFYCVDFIFSSEEGV